MPFQSFPNWQDVVRGKWLIFDTDALISIIQFDAMDLFEELRSLGITFTYINPVLLELMNTERSKDKLKRASVLSDYGFTELPVNVAEMKNANRIQKSWPIGVKGNPSSTDYYLGGVLARYSNESAYILTSNVKDFPQPIFTRKAFIPLVNQTDFKGICIVGIDGSKLVEV